MKYRYVASCGHDHCTYSDHVHPSVRPRCVAPRHGVHADRPGAEHVSAATPAGVRTAGWRDGPGLWLRPTRLWLPATAAATHHIQQTRTTQKTTKKQTQKTQQHTAEHRGSGRRCDREWRCPE